MANKQLVCTFCGARHEEVKTLIVGLKIGDVTPAICNECVELCVDIVNDVYAKEITAVMATASYPCGSMGEEIDHAA